MNYEHYYFWYSFLQDRRNNDWYEDLYYYHYSV